MKRIKYLFYRSHMTIFKGKLIKDLKKIGRDLNSIFILDDNPEYYILQP